MPNEAQATRALMEIRALTTHYFSTLGWAQSAREFSGKLCEIRAICDRTLRPVPSEGTESEVGK